MSQPETPYNPSFAERLLKLREVSDFLQISPSTVYRLVEERKIPFIRVGGAIRFKPRNILEWVERQQRGVLGNSVGQLGCADLGLSQTEGRRRSL
jgi:excisionase family DNA binding protein